MDEFGDIYNLAPKPFTEVKPTSDRIKREAGELRLTEELSRQRAMREAEVEKSLEQQPTGKGAEVNQSVMDALKKYNIFQSQMNHLLEFYTDIIQSAYDEGRQPLSGV